VWGVHKLLGPAYLKGEITLSVLAERPRAMILVTAYCTDIESHRDKLRKERDEYCRKQKPPGGTT
jgi:hypothetical protein